MSRPSFPPRTYRIVKLVIGERQAWIVVSSSLRDDDTWDVIVQCGTRTEAFDYVQEVTERNAASSEVGCNA